MSNGMKIASWRAKPPQPSGSSAPSARSGQNRVDTPSMLREPYPPISLRRTNSLAPAVPARALFGGRVAGRDGLGLGARRRLGLHGEGAAHGRLLGGLFVQQFRSSGALRTPRTARRSPRTLPRRAPRRQRSAGRGRACRARARRRSGASWRRPAARARRRSARRRRRGTAGPSGASRRSRTSAGRSATGCCARRA